MTGFENTGISFQNESASREEAKRHFQRSCSICCDQGIRIDCERCGISIAHEAVLEAFDALHGTARLSPGRRSV